MCVEFVVCVFGFRMVTRSLGVVGAVGVGGVVWGLVSVCEVLCEGLSVCVLVCVCVCVSVCVCECVCECVCV